MYSAAYFCYVSGYAVSKVVSCQPLVWRPRFAIRSVQVGFVVKGVSPRQVFLRVLQFPHHNHCTNAPYACFIHLQLLLYNVSS